jgi:methyl-accepting chemotaxis protein
MKNDEIADALRETLISPNVTDANSEAANLVDAVDNGSRALWQVGRAIERLGLNEASTSMGAIEVLAKEIKEGSERIASALSELAEAIRERK